MKLEWNNLEEQIGSWAKYLTPIFESQEMYDLYQEFKGCKDAITPLSKDLFKFLKACQPDKLQIIFIGMDSYPGRYTTGDKLLHADGIAFSCSNSPDDALQPSLESFYDGLEKEYEEKFDRNKNLSYLCEQGVMLGNRSLNCKVGKTGEFMGKWDFFWKYFLEEVITSYFPGIPIVLLGKDASFLKSYISEKSNPVYELNHPSYAARNKRIWDTKEVFKTINNIIKQNNGSEFQIIWDSRLYKDSKECPF